MDNEPVGQYAWVEEDPSRIRALLKKIEEARRAGYRYYAEKKGPVISVYFDVSAGWKLDLLLRSDVHWDSVKCMRDLALKHLKMVVERDGLALDGGDFADAMQGRFDPRRNYADIRPEYLRGNKYYDNILDDLEESHGPFAKYFLLLARGNHETAVIKNANTDLTDRLVDRLNRKHGGQVFAGAYGAWVRFVFLRSGRHMTTLTLRYFHGSGGEAPVTRGVIQTNRQATFLANADIVWNGHNHHSYIVPIKRQQMSKRGEIYFDIQWHIRTPGYKNEYGDGSEGWEVERGGVPKPFGAAFVHLSYASHLIEVRATQEVE